MSLPPPVTPEGIRRFAAVQTAHMVSRLGCIAEAPGNPLGMDIQAFGAATAFRMRGAPGWDFPNFCAGADPGQLDAILAFYRDAGIAPRFELTPGELTDDLGRALHDRGFYQFRVHTMLYGPARPSGAPWPQGVTIHEVSQPADLEAFLDVTLAAFGLKPGATEGAKVNQRRWLHRPGWTLFLAKVDGRPAGGAVLYVRDRIGHLAYAGTAEEFRGRGCQSALIEARLARAAELECELVTGAAYFGTASQRNQQRAGLNLACLQSIWKSRS